jgi:hypothetical protein
MMSSELKDVLIQAKQLGHQDQDQLISYLADRLPQSQQHSDNPWLAIAGDLVDDPYRQDLDFDYLNLND